MPKSNPLPKRRTKRLPRGKHNGVELLLIQAVDHVGAQGDVVEVKRGYAMNYLLPQGLATIATDHHKRMVEKHRAKLQEIQNARMAGLRDLAGELNRQSVPGDLPWKASAPRCGRLRGTRHRQVDEHDGRTYRDTGAATVERS